MTDISISLDNSMFAPGHAYTALSRAQRWDQISISALCREAFRVDEQAIAEYDRLEGIATEVYGARVNVMS